MTINISLQDVGENLHPKITVLGVGGSGGNARFLEWPPEVRSHLGVPPKSSGRFLPASRVIGLSFGGALGK